MTERPGAQVSKASAPCFRATIDDQASAFKGITLVLASVFDRHTIKVRGSGEIGPFQSLQLTWPYRRSGFAMRVSCRTDLISSARSVK